MLKSSTHPLLVAARSRQDTLAIQNDGDEIPSADPLLHLKHCDIKTGNNQIAMPCVMYKHSTHWLPYGKRLKEFDRWMAMGLGDAADLEVVATHWWTAGPTVVPLQLVRPACPCGCVCVRACVHACVMLDRHCCSVRGAQVLKAGTLPRYSINERSPQMGPGAAFHLSNTAEPVSVWLKGGGVIEDVGTRVVSPDVLAAIRHRNVTPAVLGAVVPPICSPTVHHLSDLPPSSQKLMRDMLPWPLRENPERYPFFLPSAGVPQCWTTRANKKCFWSGAGPAATVDSQCIVMKSVNASTSNG